VTLDPDATVDAWIAGGLQFANGAAYSYVVVVGTGSASEPWARNLHSAQLAAPLLETLLLDLEAAPDAPADLLAPARRPLPPLSASAARRAPRLTTSAIRADELRIRSRLPAAAALSHSRQTMIPKADH
jgi:hypothetical protein